MAGLGTFRDSSVAFRRDDGVGMGGSSGPKVVGGGWNIIGARYDGQSSGLGHTWDGAFLAIYKQGRQGAASVVVADSALS